MEHMKYVVGFLFDESHENVVLVRKKKPKWQRGLLNGIGGKIEKNEKPQDAMKREFYEETGLEVNNFRSFAHIKDKSSDIYFYYANDKKKNIEQARSMEEERIEIHKVNKINDLPVINNLRFLVPLAMDEDWYGSFTPK